MQVAAGSSHTIGLKADGRVVAVGNNNYGQCNVTDWTNIVQVAAGDSYTVGLKADGTVAVGDNELWSVQCGELEWYRAGGRRLMGIRSG